VALITCPECGTEVSDQALACVRCGFPINPPRAAPAPEPTPMAVALSKFIILSLTSLGLYLILWTWRQWKWVQARRDRAVSPFLRTLFSPLFMFSLLRHLEGEGESEGIDVAWSPGLHAVAYLAIIFGSWVLPDPYWLIVLVVFAPLLAPQATANAIATARTGEPVRATYSGGAIAVVVIGSIILLMALIGTFLPEFVEEAAPVVTA